MIFERLAPWAPWAIVAVAMAALSMALIAQDLYDLEPCILCLYQRLPYIATALLALLALKLPPGSNGIAAIVGLCGVIYLIGSGIAVYHVGVEQHWWVSGCTGAGVGEMSFDQLRSALTSKAAKACDDIDWTLFGISMAMYNVVFSAGLGLIAIWAARLIWRNNEPIPTPAR